MLSILLIYLENLMCFAMFFGGFPRREHFALRFFPLALLTACALCPLGAQFLPMENPLILFYFLVEFAALTAVFHFCFQTSWEQALYSASAGRATQHLISSVLDLIYLYAGDLLEWFPEDSLWSVPGLMLSYLPFCVLAYFGFARNRDTTRYEKGDFRRKMNLLSIMMLFICIGITRFAKYTPVYDQNTFIAQKLYAITCCLLCLIVQSELCKQEKTVLEMERVRMLWREESKQLTERRDTIELINMKCHDIRHKLEDYHLPLSSEEADELKSLVRIYDQAFYTGNQTLDVLLADRTLRCEKDHIRLSFMGDGTCLNFLTEAEVYSLFGNAVGNAIEACCALEEEKREISIIIHSSGDLISINITNYYEGQLHFKEGLPVTTRSDPQDFHGYGMKSIRTIAKKYGGEIKIKAEDGVFALTVWLVDSSAAPGEL